MTTDQSWNRSGSPAPIRPDRTRPDEKFIRPDETEFLPVDPAERNQISAGFLPDLCRIFVSLTSKMNRTDFTGFLPV
jgi:hypothetical protein